MRTTRDVPIQFIFSTPALNPPDEMDGRINGCTWPHTQFSHSTRGCVKDSRSLLESSNTSVERDSIFFPSCLSFISSFVHSLFFFFYSLSAPLCPSSDHSRYSKTSSQCGNILSSSGNFADEQDVAYRG